MFDLVKVAYETAIENGFDLDIIEAQDVAYDMVMYCEELESYPIEDVTYQVIRYRGY
jgi:hypothetical protein